MLVEFQDKSGASVWINPLHVKAVQTKSGFWGGKKGTEILLSVPAGMGGGIVVRGDVSDVARLISESMPTVVPFIPDDAGPTIKPHTHGGAY